MGFLSLVKDSITQVKAEEGFKIVVRSIAHGNDGQDGLTPERLLVMAEAGLLLRDLLTPEQIAGMRDRRNTPEVKYLTMRQTADEKYLLTLLSSALPKHGAVFAKYPDYTKRFVDDLKTILFG